MFSVVAVILFWRRGPLWAGSRPPPQTRPPPDMFKLVQLAPHCTGNPHPGHVKTCSLWSVNCRKAADGWHSAEMHSCCVLQAFSVCCVVFMMYKTLKWSSHNIELLRRRRRKIRRFISRHNLRYQGKMIFARMNCYFDFLCVFFMFGGHKSFCGATDTPVSDFWCRLSWLSMQGCVLCHLHVMDSSDSPLVQHLLTFWWSAWQLSHFYPHTGIQALVGLDFVIEHANASQHVTRQTLYPNRYFRLGVFGVSLPTVEPTSVL